MSDAESTPPDRTTRQQPGWLTPVGVAAAVVALALASFGLGRTTGNQTLHMRSGDMRQMSQMMRDVHGSMPANGMPMDGMPMMTTTTLP